MSRHILSSLLLCASTISGAAEAQEIGSRQQIDASSAALNDTVHLDPGRYEIVVVNTIPRFRSQYVVSSSRGTEIMGPITRSVADTVAAIRGACPSTHLSEALAQAQTESDIAIAVAVARAASDASGVTEECRQATNVQIATTVIRAGTYDLSRGQYVLIDVKRIGEAASVQRHWVRRFTTGPQGAWRATYGYTFPALMRLSKSRLVQDGHRFVTKQVAEGKYLIAEDRPARQFDALPAVMFTYMPADEREYVHGWTGGLAVDITKPVLFLGYGATWRSNLHVSIGAAFREESVEIGQYSIGDTVATNLTAEQLGENAFRARPYLSVTLRFDKNPFKKEAGNETPAEKKGDAGTAGNKDGTKNGESK